MTDAEARALLEEVLTQRWDELDPVLALVLDGFGLELDGAQTTPALQAALQLAATKDGLGWLALDERYPERKRERERRARYCCSVMFEAVNNPGHPLHFLLTTDRDVRPIWLAGGTVVHFCPWCGRQLPKRHFEESKQ